MLIQCELSPFQKPLAERTTNDYYVQVLPTQPKTLTKLKSFINFASLNVSQL